MKKYLIMTLITFFLSCVSVYAQGPPMFSGAGGGAPTDAHYLVDLANGDLTAEVVVSANGKSLVTAANYAAMRGLLDLEAGTDFNAYIKNKIDATQAPTVDNDIDEGYAVRSLWFDVTNDKGYICLDITDGAAVWTEISDFTSATAGTDYSKPGTVPTNSNLNKAPISFVANDLTPSVAGGNHFYTANTGEVRTITMLDGGTAGQRVWIEVRDAYTKFDFSGTNLIGNYGNDVTFDNGDWIFAAFDGTNWECFIYHDTIPLKEWAFAFGADALGDDVYMGETASGRNAGETTVQWDCLYWDRADAEWKIAENTGIDTGATPDTFNRATGMGVSAGSDGAAIVVLTKGVVRNDGWAWTAGMPLYLSTGGDMTHTRPISANAFVQQVGIAITDDEVWFDPQPIDWSAPRYGTDADGITFNAIQVNNTIWVATGAQTMTLPAVAEVPVINMTVKAVAAAVHIDPNDADKFIDVDTATTWDDGDKITSTSTAGDIATVMTGTTDGPTATTNGWTDGGA